MALVDRNSAVQFHARVWPTVPVEPEAPAVHGLRVANLLNTPEWPEAGAELQPSLSGLHIMAFNTVCGAVPG